MNSLNTLGTFSLRSLKSKIKLVLVSISSTSSLASPGSSFTITVQNLSTDNYTYTVNLTGITTADVTNTVLTGSIPSNTTIQYTNSVPSESVASGSLVFSINNTENTQYTVSFAGLPIYINVTAATGTVLTTQNVYWVQMSLKDGTNTVGSRQEKPYITLLSGKTYQFKYPTAYRLRLSETPPTGTSGTNYSNGVTINDGVTTGQLFISMSESKTLYYYSLDLANMGPLNQTSLYKTYSIIRNFYNFNSSNFNTTTLGFKDLVTNTVKAVYTKAFEITSVNTTEPKEYTTNTISRVSGNTSFRLFKKTNEFGTRNYLDMYNNSLHRITSTVGFSINYWMYTKKFDTNDTRQPWDVPIQFGSIDTSTGNLGGSGVIYYANSPTSVAFFTGIALQYFSTPSYDRNGLQWIMVTITMTMDGSNNVNQKYYHNSNLCYNTTLGRSSGNFNPIGTICITGPCDMSGYLDQYTVHDRVLTQSEITAIYNDTGNIQYM